MQTETPKVIYGCRCLPRLGGLGERRKLPQRGPGWSPGRKWILCISEVRKKPCEIPFQVFLSDCEATKRRGAWENSPLFSTLDGPLLSSPFFMNICMISPPSWFSGRRLSASMLLFSGRPWTEQQQMAVYRVADTDRRRLELRHVWWNSINGGTPDDRRCVLLLLFCHSRCLRKLYPNYFANVSSLNLELCELEPRVVQGSETRSSALRTWPWQCGCNWQK